jgi:two-component system, chemotaxis family, CheB/CheR fusion protein
MKDTTIVAVTGYGQVHDRTRTAAVGFDHHLTKPVEFSALQELLRARR